MPFSKIVTWTALVLAGAIMGFSIGGMAQIEETPTSHENPSPLVANADHDNLDRSSHESGWDWCEEHWVPESECTICHPELVKQFQQRGDWCPEHGFPESHCRKCNPRLTFPQEPERAQFAAGADSVPFSVFFPPNSDQCNSEQALIQFASKQTAAKIGLGTEPVLTATSYGTAEAPAELVFDATRTSAVTTAVSATVIQSRVGRDTIQTCKRSLWPRSYQPGRISGRRNLGSGIKEQA